MAWCWASRWRESPRSWLHGVPRRRRPGHKGGRAAPRIFLRLAELLCFREWARAARRNRLGYLTPYKNPYKRKEEGRSPYPHRPRRAPRGPTQGRGRPGPRPCPRAVMPRIREFHGIPIWMYWLDHTSPHFHVQYGADWWSPPSPAVECSGDRSHLERSDLYASGPRARQRAERETASHDRGLYTDAHRALAIGWPSGSQGGEGESPARVPAQSRVQRQGRPGDRPIGCALGEMFEPLRDPEFFRQVRMDEASRSVVWPNGLDLDPEMLHDDAEPARPIQASEWVSG
jgi:hypothetical protein